MGQLDEKIKTRDGLARIVRRIQRRGKRVAAMSGSFDLMHAGHIAQLVAARKNGDALAVLLNSDASVRAYKGRARPLIPQEERAVLLAALACVDYVAIFDELTPKAILEKVRPAIFCNGSDWGKNCIERATVEAYGGRVVLLPSPKRTSSGIIRDILRAYADPAPKAVFLDRDGTLNDSGSGYIYRADDFRFLPGVIPALRRLSKTTYKVIVITNQSGIRSGYYTKHDLEKLHGWMTDTLKRKKVRIDRIYYCPHVSRDNCECRKPKPGMFLEAVRDFGVSLNDSWFVGDDARDVAAGREANIKTIKIGSPMPRRSKLEPHAYARDLGEAVRMILAEERPGTYR